MFWAAGRTRDDTATRVRHNLTGTLPQCWTLR